jgi:DNA replication licensing factor MCM4
MNLFRDFLRNFKPKYRAAYNDKMARQAAENGDAVPPANPLYDGLSPAKANETLYLTYLRTMRLTQQTNLNLDSLNLSSFPPTRKLYQQLIAYPQEVIPIMDQVLKDVMIELSEEDWEQMEDGLERDLIEEEGREMAGRVYKVRPFGGEKVVNMRELNPQGAWENTSLLCFPVCPLIDHSDFGSIRHRQARHHQRSRHPRYACHSRHEAG